MDDQRHIQPQTTTATGAHGVTPRQPAEPADAQRMPGADVEDEMFELENASEGTVSYEVWIRMRGRRLLREFLRAVPRGEADATIAILRADGVNRIYTRGELSTAIDRLRPRQRQIVRLAIEERWPRARVCQYLKDISIKTLERDQVEALDLLLQL